MLTRQSVPGREEVAKLRVAIWGTESTNRKRVSRYPRRPFADLGRSGQIEQGQKKSTRDNRVSVPLLDLNPMRYIDPVKFAFCCEGPDK